MNHIITSTQVQQKIGQITASIGEKTYIVTNRGEGKIIMLPYFDGCDEFITDYLEDYEMYKNKTKLQKRYKQSSKSGKGSLII